jgi:hypothetical protein
MTVKEMIAALSELPQDAHLFMRGSGCGYHKVSQPAEEMRVALCANREQPWTGPHSPLWDTEDVAEAKAKGLEIVKGYSLGGVF